MFWATFFTNFAEGSVPDEAPVPAPAFPNPVRTTGLEKRGSSVSPTGWKHQTKRRIYTMITLIIACVAVAGLFMIAGYDYRSVKE